MGVHGAGLTDHHRRNAQADEVSGPCLTKLHRTWLQVAGQLPLIAVAAIQRRWLPMALHQRGQPRDNQPVYQRLGVAVREKSLRSL